MIKSQFTIKDTVEFEILTKISLNDLRELLIIPSRPKSFIIDDHNINTSRMFVNFKSDNPLNISKIISLRKIDGYIHYIDDSEIEHEECDIDFDIIFKSDIGEYIL